MADTIKTLITGVDQLSPTLAAVSKNVKGFQAGLEGSGLGSIPLENMVKESVLAQPFIDAVKAAVGFETSMAGVKRSVTFENPQQFQAMSRDILDLSERLPESASGIAAIVSEGAKASVPREELTGFASDAVKMGIAFDQTAAQSGEMMGKWRSSFEMTQPQVAALSEKINVLGGNNLEKQIATMVTAMGPLGPVAGRASGEIAAMGATLAGVDVPTDVAAKGMKNFMQSLTEGGAAKAGAFQALQLDIDQLTQGMQQNPSATIEKVLTAISTVDPGKQSAVITQLFGEESLGAVTPLLENLDVLRTNLAKVGEGVQSAGTIEQEFKANSETTAVALKEMDNRVDRLSINIGSMFLPAMNEAMAVIGPMISQVAALAAEHPGVIKGVVGAAIAFGVLQVAVLAATNASKVLSAVIGLSPVGMVVRALALAAGLLIANWSTVAPYFQAVWASIREPVMALWGALQKVFGWTPIGLIIANWQPLSAFFGALWDVIKALASPVVGYLQALFDWSPLGIVSEQWEPIKTFFSGLFTDIKPFIDPILSWFGGGSEDKSLLQRATQKLNEFADERRAENAGPGGGTGAFLAEGAVQASQLKQQQINQAMGIPGTSQLLGAPNLPAPGSLLLQQGAGAGSRLEGELNIRFENAPPGMRTEQMQTNQPGLTVSPSVGYRTLGTGAAS
ncbi:phage tail tape measure protein [Pseudomonas floridensis]|uniref:Phage tail tape measure protein n=1 Tax=Pseudomonas floridensis TaxID=1958950 RepID=A0A1X0N2X2_9PSED|nr:phage tail tape measure protein [Pseudomonas floridensis]ORC57729.1 phage tail tape measure protein [Pseudomonas floridensis]